METKSVNTNVFTIKHTNIAKGIAILLLIWHHLFYNSTDNYSLFKSIYLVSNVPTECLIADLCRVCVAMFLFLSGYGLYISYQKKKANALNGKNLRFDFKFIAARMIKLLSNYWFIFIIFVPLGLLFGRKFYEIYGSNPLKYIADFLGLSYLIYGYGSSMNDTWWYMSDIIVLYIAFPLLYKLQKKSGALLLTLAAFILFFAPNLREFNYWIFPFCLGIYFADNNIFELLFNRYKQNKLLAGIVSGLLIILFAYIKHKYLAARADSFFAASIIIFSFFLLSEIPFISTALETLGKYSSNIFMFHTFIKTYYFKDIVYSLKFSLLIYVVMILVCLLLAFLIEKLKTAIRYDKLFGIIYKRIDNAVSK